MVIIFIIYYRSETQGMVYLSSNIDNSEYLVRDLPDKEIAVIIEVAEYMYQSAMVVDKEITFMACVAKLIKTIGK